MPDRSPKTPSQRLARELAHREIRFKQALVCAARDRGFSRDDIATKLNWTVSDVEQFERSDSNPTLSEIRYYAHAIGASVGLHVFPNWYAAEEESPDE